MNADDPNGSGVGWSKRARTNIATAGPAITVSDNRILDEGPCLGAAVPRETERENQDEDDFSYRHAHKHLASRECIQSDSKVSTTQGFSTFFNGNNPLEHCKLDADA